jgi:hypothetical protein
VAPVADAVEHCEPVVIAGNRLAVDDARAGAQVFQRLDNQGEAVGEVVARTAIEPHPCPVLAGDDPEAVMLDFVNPEAAGGQCVGLGGEARLNEAGR